MSDVVFVDSKILIYAHDADAERSLCHGIPLNRLIKAHGAGRLSD